MRGARVLVVGCLIVLCAVPVVAQETAAGSMEVDSGTGTPIHQIPEMSFEGEVTVTGSLIPRKDLTSMSPVTVMEVPQELTYSGIVRIEDLITTMPQIFAVQNSTIANGATGTATVELRYLGPQRTLVLLNGRRLTPIDATGSGGSDLHVVPAPMVKRVDVLTGGASTVYGSDAVAGVINFILDTDFTGVRGGAQYSFYNHDNNNQFAQELNREAGFDPPTGITNDGGAVSANIAVGGKFADGRGHASAYIDYRKIDELRRGARDYSNCSLDDSEDGLYCGGSLTSERGFFASYRWDVDPEGNPIRVPNGFFTLDWHEDGGDGHSFRWYTGELYNFAASNHIQRPDEKWNAGAFANYEINRHFDVYMEIMYMNNFTDAQIAPGGAFGFGPINCDNPMLSEQQHALVCSGAGFADDEDALLYIFRRNVEGGNRSNQLGHNDIRLVAGLRGDISDTWRYDFYWLRAENNQQESYLNDLDRNRLTNALDVIEDPDTGEWVCRSGGDDGCVPWDPFSEGGVTPEAVDYISTVGVSYGKVATQVFNFTATGDLEAHGLTIPSATEGIQTALGIEYREESLRNRPDEAYLSGSLAGFLSNYPQLGGGFNVKEAFVELLVPVVQDAKGAQDLTLELGYRYSDYSTAGGTNTYKAQASYAPTSSWRLRGGYNRAVRSPNVTELFYPQTLIGWLTDDICAGPEPMATVEECERTGVPAHAYGSLLENPGEGIGALDGGNPFLEPEIADTVTAGVVWTPRSIRGLSVAADYYHIDIDEAIGTFTPGAMLRLCADTGEERYCERVHRDDAYSLWMTPDGYVDITFQNYITETREGIDLNLNYLLGLGNAGYLAIDLMGSYMLESRFTDPVVDFDCTGYFGWTCGFPEPLWRHRFRATWESSFRFNLSLAWRYFHSVELDYASSNPQIGDPDSLEYWQSLDLAVAPSYNWFDVAASYTFRNGLKLTAGVNNILDEEPPLYWEGYGIFDPLGRYIFGSVQFNF